MAASFETKEQLPIPVSQRSEASSDGALWTSPTSIFSKAHLMGDVDPERSTLPLAAYCFMTGYMYVSYVFSSVPLWLTVGFWFIAM